MAPYHIGCFVSASVVLWIGEVFGRKKDSPRRYHSHDSEHHNSVSILQHAANDDWKDCNRHWKWHHHVNSTGLVNRNLGFEMTRQAGRIQLDDLCLLVYHWACLLEVSACFNSYS